MADSEFDVSLKQYDYNWHMYSVNKPNYVILKPTSKIYKIDLATRIINGPSVISIEDDHNAVQLIFEIDRYYDSVDLADTNCIIQFKTVDKRTGEPFLGLYPVRFYDTQTHPNKILLPWSVTHAVTQSAREIEYNFRFFKLEEKNSQYHLIYNLNTLSTTSSVLDSLNVYSDDLSDVYDVTGIAYENYSLDQKKLTYETLIELYKDLYNTQQLYWETPETINNQTYNNDFLNNDS